MAPASVTLTANASDSDGTVSKVDFYQGTTLIGTVTTAPYTFTVNNLGQGSYTFSAIATDNRGAATTSAAVSVTVNSGVAQVYYIYTDQLNTPRVITNQAAQVVWRWDNNDPFGGNVPDENPSSLGNFTCNLRLPGQYFDKETNLHYNYFRDYDPAIGRYIQPELLGLVGDINLYRYARDNPVAYFDPDGERAQTVVAGALVGAIIGGISGGIGAATQSTNITQGIIQGALVGAATGAVGGLIISGVPTGVFSPAFAAVAVTGLRATAGAIGNLLGQGQAINDPCFQFNFGSVFGAALGGAITAPLGIGLGLSQTPISFGGQVVTGATSIPGSVVFNIFGTGLGIPEPKCGCK